MDRTPRNRKAVNYSDFQDNDDEDFAAVKPPMKKPRATTRDPDTEAHHRVITGSQTEVVNLPVSRNRTRVSVFEMYERDLEAALTLSLLDPIKTDLQPTSTTDQDRPFLQCSPPVLTHCSEDGKHQNPDQARSASPPVLSNCSVDATSLGLNLISSATPSPVSVSKLKINGNKKLVKEKKGSKDDEEYQPQKHISDSESDEDFNDEDQSENETFSVKKANETTRQKTKNKIPPSAKDKKEKKEKKNISKAKSKSSVGIRSPVTPASGEKKTPTTPPLCKTAPLSSPAGGRPPKWTPPGLVGRNSSGSPTGLMKSPGHGLRLGLSRLARVKPLHPNAVSH